VCLCTGRQTKDEAASSESVPGNNMGRSSNMAICNDLDLKGEGGAVHCACAGAGAGADNEQSQLVSFEMTSALGEVSARASAIKEGERHRERKAECARARTRKKKCVSAAIHAMYNASTDKDDVSTRMSLLASDINGIGRRWQDRI